MQLEFLMCGNHTDAFLSQAAIYRLMLDSFGGDHRAARLVLCVGGPEREALPDRWRPFFDRIEVIWVDQAEYLTHGDLAQSDLIYQVIDPQADISIICDADTLLLQPLPREFITAMQTAPALCGCIAHFAPPLRDKRRPPPPPLPDHAALWDILSTRILGRPIEMPYSYALGKTPSTPPEPCPFYINLGFFAATPGLFKAFHRNYRAVIAEIRQVLDNDFYEQIAVPYVVALNQLSHRELPMRYNFPNDPLAEGIHPAESENIVNIHYLRTNLFNRHRIFAGQNAFDDFMTMPLSGSNLTFREAVRRLTGGAYPF